MVAADYNRLGDALALASTARMSKLVVTISDFTSTTRVVAGRASGGEAGAAAAKGVAWVLQSLTPNHRSILRVLLELAVSVDKAAPAASYDALREECENQMLARTEASLKQHLGELIDHGIVERAGGRVVVKGSRAELEAALSAIGR